MCVNGALARGFCDKTKMAAGGRGGPPPPWPSGLLLVLALRRAQQHDHVGRDRLLRRQGGTFLVFPPRQLHDLADRAAVAALGVECLDDVQPVTVDEEGMVAENLGEARGRGVVFGNGIDVLEAVLLFELVERLLDQGGGQSHRGFLSLPSRLQTGPASGGTRDVRKSQPFGKGRGARPRLRVALLWGKRCVRLQVGPRRSRSSGAEGGCRLSLKKIQGCLSGRKRRSASPAVKPKRRSCARACSRVRPPGAWASAAPTR